MYTAQLDNEHNQNERIDLVNITDGWIVHVKLDQHISQTLNLGSH
jgi:hypothetical protein